MKFLYKSDESGTNVTFEKPDIGIGQPKWLWRFIFLLIIGALIAMYAGMYVNNTPTKPEIPEDEIPYSGVEIEFYPTNNDVITDSDLDRIRDVVSQVASEHPDQQIKVEIQSPEKETESMIIPKKTINDILLEILKSIFLIIIIPLLAYFNYRRLAEVRYDMKKTLASVQHFSSHINTELISSVMYLKLIRRTLDEIHEEQKESRSKLEYLEDLTLETRMMTIMKDLLDEFLETLDRFYNSRSPYSQKELDRAKTIGNKIFACTNRDSKISLLSNDAAFETVLRLNGYDVNFGTPGYCIIKPLNADDHVPAVWIGRN